MEKNAVPSRNHDAIDFFVAWELLKNTLTNVDVRAIITAAKQKGDTDMENYDALNAKVMKAFCDENRLAVLRLLCTGEKCACRLQDALSISQSTLSHHMKILCESGLVSARKEGKWTYYSLSDTGCADAAKILAEYTHAISRERDPGCQP